MRVFCFALLSYAALAVATGDFLFETDSDARWLGILYALDHPSWLLDPWLKPVITFLCAPVLALGGGAIALKVVQAALAAATLALTRAAAVAAGAKDEEALLAAALAGLAPYFVRNVASLLTEISCALFLAGALLLWLRDRPALSALVVSCSFLARFEGAFFALAWAPFLFRRRCWPGLALLGAAPAAWHLAGWAATGDATFLFSRQPHPWGHSGWGSGPWWWYVAMLPVAAGALVVPAVAGVKRAPGVALAAISAVLLGHTVLWTFGLLGAYGLPRYLVTVVPALAVAAAPGLERFPRLPRAALFLAAAAGALFVATWRPNSWLGARELARQPGALTDDATVARLAGGPFTRIRDWRAAPPGARIAWESRFADDEGAFREIPPERLALEWSITIPPRWPWERAWTGRIYRLK